MIRGPARRTVLAGVGSALMLLAGFALFALDAARVSRWPRASDGIVVLTGGTQRVDAAVGLLRAGVANRLLISGVPPGVSLLDILQNVNATGVAHVTTISSAAEPWWRHVTVGHAARSTQGNAIEVAWWAHANDMHSLVVVTAGYHMRRALGDIGALLPGVRLTAYAVHPGAGPRTLALEYLKLIAAQFRAAPLGRLPAST